jgi:hypothetical protein
MSSEGSRNVSNWTVGNRILVTRSLPGGFVLTLDREDALEFKGSTLWPALRDDLDSETNLNAQNAWKHVNMAVDPWSTATRSFIEELRSGVEQIAGAPRQVATSEEWAQGASEKVPPSVWNFNHRR